MTHPVQVMNAVAHPMANTFSHPPSVIKSTNELRALWFDNFQHGQQVELSSFITALVLHFNEHYSTPLYITLPLHSRRTTPAFLPLLINSLLFICIPELASAPPSSPSSSADDDSPSPHIRLPDVEQLVTTFGGDLRTALHLAHYSLFDNTGALYPWFHGHERSIDPTSAPQAVDSFLIRFSQSQPGSLSVVWWEGGKWSKRLLTCTMEGWKVTEREGGPSPLVGVYDSIHAYIASHHSHQSPIPSPLSSLYGRTLSSSEVGVDFHKKPCPPSPLPYLTPDSEDGSSVILSDHDSLLSSTSASSFLTSLSPSLSSYSPVAGYPLILGSVKGQLPLLDSPSRASTNTSASPPSSNCSDTSGDVDMGGGGGVEGGEVESITTSTGLSPALHLFFYAIAVDDVCAVESFIRFRSVPLTASDQYGLTCVHVACAFNRVRILHLLKAVIPITLLAAVTLRRVSRLDDSQLACYTAGNLHMPYFRTQLLLDIGSTCGSVACGYQAGGCLALIQQWLAERGLNWDQLTHSTHYQLAQQDST